jgi:hypothetical protein
MNRLIPFALRGLLGLIVLLALIWVGDYVSFHYRLSHKTRDSPLETIRIQRTYAIPHKDGRAEYIFGEPEMVTCARSIFPHAGEAPCWYLQKTAAKPIPM